MTKPEGETTEQAQLGTRANPPLHAARDGRQEDGIGVAPHQESGLHAQEMKEEECEEAKVKQVKGDLCDGSITDQQQAPLNGVTGDDGVLSRRDVLPVPDVSHPDSDHFHESQTEEHSCSAFPEQELLSAKPCPAPSTYG